MAETTEIQWADSTWSPWEGCTKVSPGCDHCYAEGMNRWLRKGENWGPGAPRREYSDAHWRKPIAWNAKAEAAGKRLRVFPSVCDPFDNAVDPAWRAKFFALIACTPHLTWLLLTKRIGNAKAMLPADWGDGYPNVRIGSTFVNQDEWDRDIGKLLALGCPNFVSLEPLLGPINLGVHVHRVGAPDSAVRGVIDWVIVGSESGHGARPLHVEWVRSIVQQCDAAGVPVLVKQLGAAVLDDGMSSPGGHWPSGMAREPIPRITNEDPPFVVRLKHKKGGDLAEWPEDLRIREFPHG